MHRVKIPLQDFALKMQGELMHGGGGGGHIYGTLEYPHQHIIALYPLLKYQLVSH